MFGREKKTEAERQASKAYWTLGAALSKIGGAIVRRDPLRFTAQGQSDVPVAGAVVTVDRGEAAKRITATRVALTGVFALALRKDATKLFVTIEGTDGSVMLLTCAAKHEEAARKFAILVHTAHTA